ncbi:MAG TPA: adenylate/guanylate cyclase domain-containing protein [Ohtaekwangia sp.]|nr:adenylate/guanylate cyclase domain-containing protein [Ohtaekwangia sp.]
MSELLLKYFSLYNDTKIKNLRVSTGISEVITDFEGEEAKSEFQRSYLLVALFTLIFLASIVNFFLITDSIAQFYGGIATFMIILSCVVLFLVYQIAVLIYLKNKIALRKKTSKLFKIVHALIETSFPTAVVFYMMYEFDMLSFIDSPVIMTYFLFIILSVLHLDFSVSLLTGLFAAAQYCLLTYYGFHFVDAPPLYQSPAPENSYYVRSVILIFCGIGAAFVSAELRNRIRTAFNSQQDRNRLELLFGQHVSREVSRALIEGTGATKRLEATVMFVDVRNFTAFADVHTAEEVIDYQNKFLGPVIDIINQHQGVVFQILGDGLMACFGSPVENVLHADMAFQASVEILKRIQYDSDNGIIPSTTIGIGLHSGEMVTGNIGNEQRKQFSISGTPVIVASRIEQLNKKYDSQFLISGEVLNRVAPGKMNVSYLGEEPLRGIGKPVEVYKVDFTR